MASVTTSSRMRAAIPALVRSRSRNVRNEGQRNGVQNASVDLAKLSTSLGRRYRVMFFHVRLISQRDASIVENSEAISEGVEKHFKTRRPDRRGAASLAREGNGLVARQVGWQAGDTSCGRSQWLWRMVGDRQPTENGLVRRSDFNRGRNELAGDSILRMGHPRGGYQENLRLFSDRRVQSHVARSYAKI
jgi:hypothetical protein